MKLVLMEQLCWSSIFCWITITPSTEIAETMAKLLPTVGGKFIQMEDEIASMGAVLGASLAGQKTLTATSGPGFSLKQELIGYASLTEIPTVIVNVQRVGPSTGQPTSPAQGDIMQTRWGTHGDHSIIVLSPWSVNEVFNLTVMAVNYAERFRLPVILLMDEIIGHLRENIKIPAKNKLNIYPRRQPKLNLQNEYYPYEPDSDLVPNIANFGEGYHIHVTGLIHDKTGFPSSNPQITQNSIKRLHQKLEIVQDEIIHYEEYFIDDADFAIVSYGGSSRTAYQAMLDVRNEGYKVGMIRLQTIWPFANKVIAQLAKKVKTILVTELNYGQLVHEVKRASNGNCQVEFLGKYNTLGFESEEIKQAIIKLYVGGKIL